MTIKDITTAKETIWEKIIENCYLFLTNRLQTYIDFDACANEMLWFRSAAWFIRS